MAQRERHNSMGSSSGIDYPRKRTAIACEICRTRRSKCDAKKPACSKCVELEVECVYRRPNLWDREPVTAAATAALGKVDDRLDHIQDSISALAEQVHNIARSNGTTTSHIDHASPLAFSPQTIPNNPSQQQQQPYQNHGPPSYRSFSAAQPPGYRLPNLISFSAPPSLGPQFTYDTSIPFFTHEVSSGNDLYAALENYTTSTPPDFSPQTTWRLQRAFVSGLLRWMPIFDDETCFHHVQKASENGFGDGSASACLSLLVFAIGSMSVDEGLYSEDPYLLPGFAYLAAAYRILNARKAPIGDVEHLQCRSLFSVYLNFAIRPVQSWHEINLVTRDCMILLKTNWRGDSSPSTTTLKERVFWVAFVLEKYPSPLLSSSLSPDLLY
ncbi:hypothetical protein BJ875DRAFT_488064 [Amylocarpus encephaloides]|uniref:Zn(2)-C6 fungal-type domain-containing protein n=1 Tax=Amylocarpus encephaloides TaxID=45428 RepID=A0A9P7YAJ8_9HELO|nr:hypothetical protein BJ875DRAFT_488064 [Amylocarpus encephaloides]